MSFKIIHKSVLLRHHHQLANRNLFFKRFILSPAYRCTEEWNKRLQEPLIRDIELDTFFYQLNEKLAKKKSITPTDVDLYMNRADKSNLSEVINLMQRFRKNWRCHGMLDSTRHAFIRILLENGDFSKLTEVLSKRVEYGAFPDKFCYNMILDAMLEAGDYENASKVAVLRMLQEDFDSQIGNYLSLKAVHLYVTKSEAIKAELFAEPVVKQEDEEEATGDEEEDEDEVEYVRVPYLRNPFFDDHFDIKETYSLLGKTYWLTGNAIKSQNMGVFTLLI